MTGKLNEMMEKWKENKRKRKGNGRKRKDNWRKTNENERIRKEAKGKCKENERKRKKMKGQWTEVNRKHVSQNMSHDIPWYQCYKKPWKEIGTRQVGEGRWQNRETREAREVWLPKFSWPRALLWPMFFLVPVVSLLFPKKNGRKPMLNRMIVVACRFGVSQKQTTYLGWAKWYPEHPLERLVDSRCVHGVATICQRIYSGPISFLRIFQWVAVTFYFQCVQWRGFEWIFGDRTWHQEAWKVEEEILPARRLVLGGSQCQMVPIDQCFKMFLSKKEAKVTKVRDSSWNCGHMSKAYQKLKLAYLVNSQKTDISLDKKFFFYTWTLPVGQETIKEQTAPWHGLKTSTRMAHMLIYNINNS